MKKILQIIFLIGFSLNITYSQGSSCTTPINLGNNGCLINQSFPGMANMSGLCVGGRTSTIYIRFTAGNCSQFTITPNFSFGSPNDELGYAIRTTSCSPISGGISCVGNIVNNEPFTISSQNSTGLELLTPGDDYILQIWGIGSNTIDICYNSNTSEQANNECLGSAILGNSTQSFFNGGDCSFSGSYDDATAIDQTPSSLCAGSLENTQWVQFSPQPGATTFQVLGTNITCTGGGCGFQFGIFSGPCSSLTPEGCYGNKVCSGGQASAGPTNLSGGLADITWTNTTQSSFTATFTPTLGSTFLGTEVFYLVMDGNADADCNYDLLGINVLTLLNLELNKFETEYFEDNKNVLLKWSTNSENENYSFTIERSFDGINYESIGSVNESTLSNESKNYEYNDNPKINGFVYYRLKWYDNNEINYSNISVVDINFVNDFSFNVIKNELVIQNNYENNPHYNLTIVNNVGQLILTKNNIQSVSEKININDFSSGIYIISIKSQLGIKTHRFVKM